jgi:hypothetical protein
MNSTESTLAPEIALFAEAVRAELADLPLDEIDDLTDGLEADLAERRSDTPDEALGDPTVYAAELRAAAGHPPRAAMAHLGVNGILPDLNSVLTVLRSRWESFKERPVVAGTVSMIVSVRPVWWVFRGAVVGMLVQSWFGGALTLPVSLPAWLAMVAAIVVSVQVGRGRWVPPRTWLRRGLLALNVALVVATPFLAASFVHSFNNMYFAYNFEEPAIVPDGLTHNGVNVSNIFAYDAEGNPIDRVQLFDQAGEPINLAGDPGAEWAIGAHDALVAPIADVPGRPAWNVYPLGDVSGSPYDANGELSEPREPEFPFLVVKPLSGYEPSTDVITNR